MTKIPFLKSFVSAILVMAVSVTSFSQADKAEASIHELIKQFDIVGLSVVVVKENDIIYTKTFGLKDIESKTPLGTNDLFRIASISKSFSATSIMQLAEAGKLSLDDDFSDLVGFKIRNPKFPEKVITLRMVLSHTSSINDSQGYFKLDVINPDKNADWTKCYNDYEPGGGYQYCNLNYNMVGAVIEKFSGERFDSYVKRHVLDPLGLYGGYYADTLNSKLFTTLYEYDSLSKKYTPSQAYVSRRKDLENYVMGYSTPIFSPTGGMKISATDLAKYMMMHMNKGKLKGVRIISKKSSKLMQTPVAVKEGYGLALTRLNDLIPGQVMTGHTGSAYGLYSALFFQPKKKFGIVVITNGCRIDETNGMNPVLKKAINILYDHLIK